MPIGSHQSAAAGTDVWLTPPAILAALGGPEGFDLDPCAPLDRPWDMARQHYTIADNGLARPWHGRVWLNPPYSNNVIARWMGRMADHAHGIALIFARTETQVFHESVWRACDALLFMEGRLHFHDAAGLRAKANAGAPSVFCAYGAEDAERLAASGIPGAFVPLRLRSLVFGFASIGSWVDEVLKVMQHAGDAVRLDDLYRELAGNPKAGRNPNWKAKIRQTLQRGPFEPLGDGVWKLDTGRLL
ncbi:DNA N-6-adenine-methyltransferase [Mesorhizobium sp. M0058]|uniref:DNA N-6-adenine-methyltransferase n=1 Tax=Mesorhizobium sp. M0058 TaxID=2956865 RepID=UPI003339CDF1